MESISQGITLSPKWVILPSYTSTERDLITPSGSTMVIFNTTTKKINFYNIVSNSWRVVTSA